MSHEARLDRLSGLNDRGPSDIDRAIYREIEELKRAHPDTWEDLLADIITECDPANRTERT